MYKSKNWSTKEWDCYGRSENNYAHDDETGHLCTEDEKTASLFKVLDLLRDWNPKWKINTTSEGYKSGYRTPGVNATVGGVPNSFHTQGCAADICIADQDDTDEALANTVLDAAKAWHLEDSMGIGYYGNWVHIDTRGYTARW